MRIVRCLNELIGVGVCCKNFKVLNELRAARCFL